MSTKPRIDLRTVIGNINDATPTPAFRYLELDHGNDGMVLLSSVMIPGHAHLLNRLSDISICWHLTFVTGMEDQTFAPFPYKCMCCRPEIPYTCAEERRGIIENISLSLSLAARFRRDLEGACKQNRITTVFVRKAEAWHQQIYGPLDEIELVEANEMHTRLVHASNIATFQDAFRSVDWEQSCVGNTKSDTQ